MLTILKVVFRLYIFRRLPANTTGKCMLLKNVLSIIVSPSKDFVLLSRFVRIVIQFSGVNWKLSHLLKKRATRIHQDREKSVSGPGLALQDWWKVCLRTRTHNLEKFEKLVRLDRLFISLAVSVSVQEPRTNPDLKNW